jgi:hypothetical protein
MRRVRTISRKDCSTRAESSEAIRRALLYKARGMRWSDLMGDHESWYSIQPLQAGAWGSNNDERS